MEPKKLRYHAQELSPEILRKAPLPLTPVPVSDSASLPTVMPPCSSSAALLATVVPPAVVPTIFLLQWLGLYKTLIGLILVQVSLQLSFAILILRALPAR